jgi:dihydrofolate reductase
LAEGFIPHWAAVAAEPANPEQAAGKKYTDTPKVVFTKTLKRSPWENTVLATGDLVREVYQLKSQPGGDMIVYGGSTLVSSLIKERLIDEYHLFINTAAIGLGMAPFCALDRTSYLTLVKSIAFDCGIVLLHYEPKQG